MYRGNTGTPPQILSYALKISLSSMMHDEVIVRIQGGGGGGGGRSGVRPPPPPPPPPPPKNSIVLIAYRPWAGGPFGILPSLVERAESGQPPALVFGLTRGDPPPPPPPPPHLLSYCVYILISNLQAAVLDLGPPYGGPVGRHLSAKQFLS